MPGIHCSVALRDVWKLPARMADCTVPARGAQLPTASQNVAHTPPEVVDERLWAVHNRLTRHVGRLKCVFPGHGRNAAITVSGLYKAAARPGRPLVCGWLWKCFAYL